MMTQQDVSSYLVRVLSDSSTHYMSGAGFSALVKASFPRFSLQELGYVNLRDFIRRSVPEITEVGRAGTDIVYGLRTRQQFETPAREPLSAAQTLAPEVRAPLSTTEPPMDSTTIVEASAAQRSALSQLLANPAIWKTFSSPDGPFQLYMIPNSGLVRVLPPQAQPDPSWYKINPISAETLLQIAKDFIEQLPEPQREPLQGTLSQPRWWFPYFEVLRTFGLTFKWRHYKRRRVAQEFEGSIPKLQLTPPAPEPRPMERKPALADTAAEPRPPGSVLKRVAVEVIGRMTEPELRALNLPLGYVVDSLAGR